MPGDDELRQHESRRGRSTRTEAEPILRAAVEGGITFFDTADVYNGGESEVLTGRLLRKLFGMREEYVVATKVHGRTMPGENGQGLSRKHIMASIDASLQRLEMDYVDLYQIHRFDPHTPVEETMDALHDVVQAGKARYIGRQLDVRLAVRQAPGRSASDAASSRCRTTTTSLYREEEREMIPQCIDQGVGVIPWSPLARGMLAGNRRRGGEQADDARPDRRVRRHAVQARARLRRRSSAPTRSPQTRGVPTAQVALAWLLRQARGDRADRRRDQARHLEDALAAEQLELSDDEIERARGALRPARDRRALVSSSDSGSNAPCHRRDTDTVQRRPSNRVLVLFGATGDLAKRKLFPGFFHLYRAGLMPEDFRIIGSGRHSPGSDDEFREHVHEALERVRPHGARRQLGRFRAAAELRRLQRRRRQPTSPRRSRTPSRRSTPRASGSSTCRCRRARWQDMVRMLGATGIAENCSLVVEKPFGHDVSQRASELNAALHEVLEEESIYRIDHFLGKEAAQNILALRFANGILEPVWNRDHVAYVQIDVPEKIDIQGRAGLL